LSARQLTPAVERGTATPSSTDPSAFAVRAVAG